MTRTYALIRLLEHGPLTISDMMEIMGGCRKTVYRCARSLYKNGVIVPDGQAKGEFNRQRTTVWKLAVIREAEFKSRANFSRVITGYKFNL